MAAGGQHGRGLGVAARAGAIGLHAGIACKCAVGGFRQRSALARELLQELLLAGVLRAGARGVHAQAGMRSTHGLCHSAPGPGGRAQEHWGSAGEENEGG